MFHFLLGFPLTWLGFNLVDRDFSGGVARLACIRLMLGLGGIYNQMVSLFPWSDLSDLELVHFLRFLRSEDVDTASVRCLNSEVQ